MPSPNLSDQSAPIPINYTASYNGFSDNPPMKKQFFFTLETVLKDNKKKIFKKIENEKYSYIIEDDDMINYSDVISFEITVQQLPLNNPVFSMKGKIDHSNYCYTQKNENFYIEFTKKENNNNTICTCYFIGLDFNNIFISPPN